MMIRQYYSKYLLLNESRPALTKCATASTLMCLGDFLCQQIEIRKYHLNKRTLIAP